MTVDMELLEDRLAATACMLVQDIRNDRDAAHRTLAAMDRLELEQVTCVLAAMVDPDINLNVMAWWRVSPAPAGVAA